MKHILLEKKYIFDHYEYLKNNFKTMNSKKLKTHFIKN